MQLRLADRVRLEVAPEGSRAIARIFVGERELPATPELLRAVAELCAGSRQLPFALLEEHRVLVPPVRSEFPGGPLALKGTVAVGVRLRAGSARVRVRGIERSLHVLPQNSHPIGGFVAPDVLGPIQHLADGLRDAWFQMLRAAHSRGRLVDAGDATTRLLALVEERLAEDPNLADRLVFFDGRLRPRAPLQQDTWAYPIQEVELITDRLPSASVDRIRFGLEPFEGPSLGRLLGTYGRGADADAVRASFADAPRLIALAGGLVGAAFLESRPAAVAVEPGCVAHLGHATLLANLGGAHVLIDPWFPPGSAGDAEPPLSPSRLPELAGIFFTHHHWDHVNLLSLLTLDKRVPVYVPFQDPGALLAPRTAAWLRALGFTDVRELAHGDAVDVGAGGRVVAAPFTGEDPTDTRWVGNTWVLVHQGAAAWVHVDAGPDRRGRSTVSDGTAASLVERFGRLDPVFATRRQERGTMVEHSWEFLFTDPGKWALPTENCCNDAPFLGSLARATSGTVVLYSEGGASWYPDATDFLTPGEATASDAVRTYLWDDLPTIEAACGGRVAVSQPRAVWRIGGGRAAALSW